MHGNLDNLIPLQHAIDILDAAKTNKTRLHIMWNCSHTSYNRAVDIAFPVATYILEQNINTTCSATSRLVKDSYRSPFYKQNVLAIKIALQLLLQAKFNAKSGYDIVCLLLGFMYRQPIMLLVMFML